MRSRTLFSVSGLALLMWGCPKRQTAPRVVYVPSPPPAVEKAPAPASGALIINEPAPPEPPPPVIIEQEPPPEEKPAQHKRRSPSTGHTEAGPEDVATPAPEVPALEPRESAAQQTAQRQQIIEMLARIRGRVAQFKRDRLGEMQRKTLDDAQMFLEQSQRALDTNDLVRALNLARKASLLVNALQ